MADYYMQDKVTDKLYAILKMMINNFRRNIITIIKD